jgi:hypothetical protein
MGIDWATIDQASVLNTTCDIESRSLVGNSASGRSVYSWSVETAGADCRKEQGVTEEQLETLQITNAEFFVVLPESTTVSEVHRISNIDSDGLRYEVVKVMRADELTTEGFPDNQLDLLEAYVKEIRAGG